MSKTPAANAVGDTAQPHVASRRLALIPRTGSYGTLIALFGWGELGVSGGLGNVLINSYPPSEGFSPGRFSGMKIES